MSKNVRRAALALSILAAPAGMSLATPASADTILPRLSTGGCITGIADTYEGKPVCRIVGGESGGLTVETSGDWLGGR